MYPPDTSRTFLHRTVEWLFLLAFYSWHDGQMAEAMRDGCLICAELNGHVEVPGGRVIDGPLVAAFHVPPLSCASVYAGHLLVVPQTHAAGFAKLTDQEPAARGIAVADLTRRLQRVGRRRVYGDGRPQRGSSSRSPAPTMAGNTGRSRVARRRRVARRSHP